MALGNSHAGSMARAQTDLYYIQQPLVRFLDRVLGPRDLYGFLTSRNTAKDLVLGQKTVSVEAQIMDATMRMNAITAAAGRRVSSVTRSSSA